MDRAKSFYFGNARVVDVRGSGWFVGQFVPTELGLRHQTDVELKWGVHPDGDKRTDPWANKNGTTISVLVEGSLKVTFHIDGAEHEVMARRRAEEASSDFLARDWSDVALVVARKTGRRSSLLAWMFH
jgi:hypothetical protein